MKIEVLYPEIANLFGDLANVRYIKASLKDCEVAGTGLKSEPLFLDESNGIDLVYMGTMTETSQVIAMDHLQPYLEGVSAAVERGQRFLFTGNAFELFAKEIVDLDDMPYADISPRVDTVNKRTACLALFDVTVKRAMMHRINSLYLGKYGDIDVTGFKSVFAYAENVGGYEPLFETVKGPGIDTKATGEGIRYKGFDGTYLTGPLMILNPPFLKKYLAELGAADADPPFLDQAMKAYEQRLNEFRRPGLNYTY